MWPRAVFDKIELNATTNRKAVMARGLEFLNKPGVYV